MGHFDSIPKGRDLDPLLIPSTSSPTPAKMSGQTGGAGDPRRPEKIVRYERAIDKILKIF